MEVILVLSSWSSGSSAIAGYLDKCGCYTCPPHVHTIDEATPCAFEPQELRDALAHAIDEQSLQQVGDHEVFKEFFTQWIAQQRLRASRAGAGKIALKHPLQAFLLSTIREVCKTRTIVVTRPYFAIEQTRLRRQWPASFGAYGAQRIYGAITSTLQQLGVPHLVVPYEDFCRNKETRADLLDYARLRPSAQQRKAAEAFIRR